MRMKIWFSAALLVLSTASVALAQEKAPSAEQKAAMDAMLKAITPGPSHKLLDAMVGTWDAKVTTWMAPGAPPSVSSATSQAKWVLGNRYIQEEFKGEFSGMPFQGIGYTGYDNVKKEYWGTWIDNMSTGVMKMTGATSDGGKTWKYTGTSTDPMTGKDVPADQRTTVTDADHHTMEMYGPGPDGKMFKTMEIVFTRKK